MTKWHALNSAQKPLEFARSYQNIIIGVNLNMTNMGIVMSLHADLRSPAVPPQREVSALFGGAL